MTTPLGELEKRLEKEPDNLSLRVTVAGLMSDAGRKAEAVELYRTVALAYRDQGRNQQAIAVCRSIIELAPDDFAIHALLAELVKHHTGRAGRDTAEQYGKLGKPTDPEVTPTSARPPPAPVEPIATGSQRIPPTGTQPPKTKSQPPASVAALLPSRPVVLRPPALRTPASGVPAKRSSVEIETPLPRAVPYHVADPTSSPMKVPRDEIEDGLPPVEGAETRPGNDPGERPETTGLAQAARRISGLIAQDHVARGSDVDLAGELDTRQRPRISAEDIERVSLPPPTVPIEMVDSDEIEDDLPTPIPTASRAAAWGRPAAKPAIPIRDTPMDPPTDLDVIAARDTDDELTAPRDLVEADPLANAFFVALPANRREAALVRCMKKSVRAGATVIRQGETSHPLILVVAGRLELRVERTNGTLAMVDTIDTGQYIGEAALLGRSPAMANVIAATDCDLLALPPHALFELAGAYPQLWAALKDTAERRTRLYERAIRG